MEEQQYDGNNVPASGSGGPPAWLPRSTHIYWSAHPDLEALSIDENTEPTGALERLGPPPLAKTGFPFIGFLATVYDHVVTHACRRGE